MIQSIGTPILWIGFTVFVFAMLALDLGVFHKKPHEIKKKEALIWAVIWITLSLIFNAGIYLYFGQKAGLEFFTGYLIEKALSVDNIFVFILIFSYFGVPAIYQHRVIFWGVLGAMIMRAVFIISGAVLLERFHWLIYVFGGFLVVTGIKTMMKSEKSMDLSKNPIVRLAQKFIPMTTEFQGPKFFVSEGGRWLATPLFLVLLVVEFTDVIFAMDSVPAIFAITKDPFIIYTSNIFAILGLRALYFLLSSVMNQLMYLKIGLGLVLTFVGIKMVISHFYQISIGISLGAVATILGASVLFSLLKRKTNSVS